MANRSLVFTRHLREDLRRIQRYVGDERFDGFVSALKASLARLSSRPGLGRPFQPSREAPQARALIRHIAARLRTDDVRELVGGEHLVLYAVTKTHVYQLSLRHQLEAGYEFD